jgi:PST family polysaccharide transporter
VTNAAEFDPPAQELRRQVTRGAVHTGAAQAIRMLTQVGSVVVLSRLLPPSEFGIVAMAGPVLAFAAIFQDMGLSQALIQKASITNSDVNSIFWINIGLNSGITIALALLGPLVGLFYHDERAGVLTSAMSLVILVSGVGAAFNAVLTRRMAFGILAIIDATSAIGALTISIVWAMFAPSYWALYGGAIGAALIPTIGTWLAAGWIPSLPRLAPGWRTLLNFGAGLTGFNFANYFTRNLDNILIGRYNGNLALGLYDRAYKLLLFPLQQINNPIARVMVPALSRLNSEPQRYRSAYLRTLAQILLVTLPGVAFLIGAANILIPILLGERWRASTPIFEALGFAGLLQPLNNTSGWLFISQGRSRDFMWWGVAGAISCIFAFSIGLPFGPVGVALAYAVSEYVRTPALWWLIARRGPIGVSDIVRTAAPHVAGAAFALIGLWLIRPALPAFPSLIALILASTLSYILSSLVIALFPAGRETLSQSRRMIWEGFRRISRNDLHKI